MVLRAPGPVGSRLLSLPSPFVIADTSTLLMMSTEVPHFLFRQSRHASISQPHLASCTFTPLCLLLRTASLFPASSPEPLMTKVGRVTAALLGPTVLSFTPTNSTFVFLQAQWPWSASRCRSAALTPPVSLCMSASPPSLSASGGNRLPPRSGSFVLTVS